MKNSYYIDNFELQKLIINHILSYYRKFQNNFFFEYKISLDLNCIIASVSDNCLLSACSEEDDGCLDTEGEFNPEFLLWD